MSTGTPPPSAPPEAPPSHAAHRRSTHSAPLRKSRTALWVWTGVAAFVVLVGAVTVVVQVSASSAYDFARAGYDRAVAQFESTQSDLETDASSAGEIATTAQAIVHAAPDGLVDTVARDAVAMTAADLSDVVADAQVLGTAPPTTDLPNKPVVFWDLLAAADEVESDTSEIEDQRSEVADAAAMLDDDVVALDDDADALYASAGVAGPAFEAAHLDARNAEVIAFRDALDALVASSGVFDESLGAMTAYAAAAQAVATSEQEEIASIGGPLFDARRAVQEFARAIDGGVLVEFDWAPTVNGLGEGGSVSGYTTWNYDHGGHAIILLSDSVAELWPSDVSQNLVAHEVGHAISSKCPTLYDDQDQASIEAFATAWAISMGYTGDGNGVSIYGQPPQSLIDSAATCR